MESKTILLTGATGFLGSYLLETLINENYKVVILKRSFSDTWRINHLLDKAKSYDIDKVPLEMPFKENEIDTVIHTITCYGRNKERTSDIVETNLMTSLKLLETAALFNVGSFYNTDTLLQRYLNPYTLSKKQFVEWQKFFSDDIRMVNLRIEHMYGPKDDMSKFVNWLIGELLAGRREIRLTPGEQKRDFIYIDDVVDAYMVLLQNEDKLSNYNEFDIGTGQQIQIKEFVLKVKRTVEDIIGREVQTHLNFGAVAYREGETMEIEEDISGILKMGWYPQTTVEDGIRKTVMDIKERYCENL